MSTDGFRSFGVVHDNSKSDGLLPQFQGRTEALRNSIIGNYSKFKSPFGDKPICYVDWTASGRLIRPVEDYLLENVLPLYGNTHTTTSITGHQSTCYRHEARQIVGQATNAKITGRAAEDIVLFTGNGTTAAVHKLVLALGLNVPLPQECRPVVFTSSYEHHSNLLPWREAAADVVTIRYSSRTGVCLEHLASQLRVFAKRKVKIGSFSAASNVSGVLTDVDSVAIMLHKAGALAFFDYATAAPYVKMDMNPVILGPDAPFVHKDAIFFSGHKFVGGPGCAGVLVVKRKVMPPQNHLPTVAGGGTVFYVTEEHHRYLSNWEEREEGGTPNLLADVKLGLVLTIQQSIGVRWIEQQELRIAGLATERLGRDPRIVLLGRDRTGAGKGVQGGGTAAGPAGPPKHLPIFSILVRWGSRFLHHNLVCALLNDLFGVQARGGCMCAGPFSQALLGIGSEDNRLIELALLDKHEVLRPGYSRFSLPFWLSQEEIDYVLDAVLFVAEHGWKFLPVYRYNHKTGEWAHTTRLTRFPERKWISNFSLGSETVNPPHSSKQAGTAAEAGRGAAVGDGGHGPPAFPGPSPSPMQEALASWGVSSLAELFSSVQRAAAAEADKATQAIAKQAKKRGGGGGGGGGGFGTAASSGSAAAAIAAAVPSFARAGGGGLDDANLDGTELGGMEAIRWFVLAEDIAVEGGSSSDSSGPVKGPLQPDRFQELLRSLDGMGCSGFTDGAAAASASVLQMMEIDVDVGVGVDAAQLEGNGRHPPHEQEEEVGRDERKMFEEMDGASVGIRSEQSDRAGGAKTEPIQSADGPVEAKDAASASAASVRGLGSGASAYALLRAEKLQLHGGFAYRSQGQTQSSGNSSGSSSSGSGSGSSSSSSGSSSNRLPRYLTLQSSFEALAAAQPAWSNLAAVAEAKSGAGAGAGTDGTVTESVRMSDDADIRDGNHMTEIGSKSQPDQLLGLVDKFRSAAATSAASAASGAAGTPDRVSVDDGDQGIDNATSQLSAESTQGRDRAANATARTSCSSVGAAGADGAASVVDDGASSCSTGQCFGRAPLPLPAGGVADRVIYDHKALGLSPEALAKISTAGGAGAGAGAGPGPGAGAGEGKRLSGVGITYPAGSLTAKLAVPPKKIMKCVGQAVKEWGMIEDGDRLLLGLSGGKDSLALLHILLALQKRAPVRFEIACATVDPQTESFDPSPLIPYVQSLGVQYHYLSEPIVELARSKLQGDSLCAFCARFKRGLLYSCCRNFNYNKLVLAQHLDDLAESFFMSALHNGQVRTMKANYKIEAGDVKVIRPLVYVREAVTRDFSQESKLPIINENCPACFEQPKERDRVKRLLRQEESMVPGLFYNLKRALLPLMHDDTYVTMGAVAAGVESAGRNPRDRQPAPKGPGARASRRAAAAAAAASTNKTKTSNSDTSGTGGKDSLEEQDDEGSSADKSVNVESSVDAVKRSRSEGARVHIGVRKRGRGDVENVEDSDLVEAIEDQEDEEDDQIYSESMISQTSDGAVCQPGGYCPPCYELV